MTNLLQNPSFEDGYYHPDGIPELAIPNGWQFWYAPPDKPRLARQDSDWFRPETVVWRKQDAPPDEQSVFFLDSASGAQSNYCLKVFKGWGPIWFQLYQYVAGLTPGAQYRFTANIYPDLVLVYNGAEKVYADDPLAGEHMLSARSGMIAETGWMNGLNIPFGRYTPVSLVFRADGDAATVSIEIRGRWGLKNNGWFIDNCSLERIDEPAPQPVLVPSPIPTPAPSPNPTPLPDGADAYYMPLPKAMQRWRARLARSHVDNLRKQKGLTMAQYSLLESLWWALDYLVGK